MKKPPHFRIRTRMIELPDNQLARVMGGATAQLTTILVSPTSTDDTSSQRQTGMGSASSN